MFSAANRSEKELSSRQFKYTNLFVKQIKNILMSSKTVALFYCNFSKYVVKLISCGNYPQSNKKVSGKLNK